MDRPILFSAPMVRALLAGTKTQTRRVVKPQPETEHQGEPYWHIGGYRAWAHRGVTDPLRMGTHNPIPCRYGKAGDRLWVRETWARDDEDGCLMYRADVGHDMTADAWEQGRIEGVPRYRWRPSIHMPRWASRITLEVTGVRVERLQDISEADARAEGCYASGFAPSMSNPDNATGDAGTSATDDYAALWESINGPGSWDANPWVWVVEFRRAA